MALETREWDPANYLSSPEEMADYLSLALRENDLAYFQHALGVAARAAGMTSVSASTGLNRENLYRSLSDDGNPRFQTVVRVLNSMGLTLDVKPFPQHCVTESAPSVVDDRGSQGIERTVLPGDGNLAVACG